MVCLTLLCVIQNVEAMLGGEYVKKRGAHSPSYIEYILSLLWDDEDDARKLWNAVEHGDREQVEQYLSENNVNTWNSCLNMSVLMFAASGNFKDIVQLLLEYKADVNLPGEEKYPSRDKNNACDGYIITTRC